MHASDNISSALNTSSMTNTSYISHTPHTSPTPHTSHESHTSHTSHKSHTSHTSRTSHIFHTNSTHQPHRQTTTKPAFAIPTLPCFLNNELLALARNSDNAALFCPFFLEYQSQIILPTYLTQFGRPQIRSACSCFDAGNTAGPSTASTVSSETDLVSTSTAPSSSTVLTSSKLSVSTAGGSVTQGNRSSSASIHPRGRFAVILVFVLVIVPRMALLKGVYAQCG